MLAARDIAEASAGAFFDTDPIEHRDESDDDKEDYYQRRLLHGDTYLSLCCVDNGVSFLENTWTVKGGRRTIRNMHTSASVCIRDRSVGGRNFHDHRHVKQKTLTI